jgi:ribonuclease P protein component
MCASDAPSSTEQQEPGTAEKSRPDMGLSRHQRLQEPRTFREAFDHGSHYAGRFMVLWLRKGEDARLRLGVVAAKRSFREAVERSRAKRLLRESYRLNRFRFSGKQDVVLVARRAILTASRQDVERDLMALAEKAGLIEKKQ